LITETMYADFDHAMRGPLSVIVGEAELVLSDADISTEERRRSVESVIAAVHQLEDLLIELRSAAGAPQ
jgi:signal transduction histidine kinase